MFRTSEWVLNKLLFNLALMLLAFNLSNLSFLNLLGSVVNLSLYVISVGALGYIINDFFDREEDSIVAKSNLISKVRLPVFLIIILLLLIVSILPGFSISGNRTIYFVLLVSQLLSFLMYSAPPFRFKSSFFGLILDSLYSFVIPGFIAINFVLDLEYVDFVPLTICLFFSFWLFILGLRSIMMHQLHDLKNDSQSGNYTTVFRLGAQRSGLAVKILVVIELILLLLFSFYYGSYLLLFIFCSLIIFLIVELLFVKNIKLNSSYLSVVTAAINSFYNLYLLCAVSIILSQSFHYLFSVIALFIILIRLRSVLFDLLKFIYYKPILYFYYKAVGFLHLLKKK